jgi:Ni,Fe-hydrogenase III large subunit
MDWKQMKNPCVIAWKDLPVIPAESFGAELRAGQSRGSRIVDFFRIPKDGKDWIVCLRTGPNPGRLEAALSRLVDPWHSVTPSLPALHIFESEISEETGKIPLGHPMLRPVRDLKDPTGKKLVGLAMPETEEMHEVGVGPVHAGIIEPGHFRFYCQGETIYHLELRLGFQRRGIDRLLAKAVEERNAVRSFSLAESIAGDTLIGHVWAHAAALETLTGTPDPSSWERGLALEMERTAIHIGDLSALCGDIGWLPGQSFFGSSRTLVINTMMNWCGSRFGRGLFRLGGMNHACDQTARDAIKTMTKTTRRDVRRMADAMFAHPGVLSRFQKTGVVDSASASDLGLTGPAARASGLGTDSRIELPMSPYDEIRPALLGGLEGDVFSRAMIRYHEIMVSLDIIDSMLARIGTATAQPSGRTSAPDMSADSLSVSIVEGWRGEIVHAIVTGSRGECLRYRIKDPSLTNWSAMAVAVRECPISDFPLCNKSFSLSYCGHDL